MSLETAYHLWLVRWGESSVDVENALNNDPFWYTIYCALRAAGLVDYDYGSYTYTLAPKQWK